ncbi:uncharacterized protein BDW47DRAFT_109833 [Aspergillus candidus]|uniref:Uncharacterized protein n=1 Tax=Aspergillus candidus TaxID=41067 RepID=A0A2I2F566_ASPCN|nr:hypothetical protein BDW47DRAFT_109833 [Aspergillus candidus]PLB35789.1 hypothetical protein BDW47DRAFT_109833 [Aspergillus candidus]
MSCSMATIQLDPGHTSCIGGRTVLTCRHCAGNAPRGAICNSCSGRGFNIFICAHCNPAGAAAAAVRTVGGAFQTSTPESSTPTSPASLSRSSSTSVSSQNDLRQTQPWRRFGDGDDGPGGGRIGANANTPRGL